MDIEETQYSFAERACRDCKMEERKVPVCGRDGHTYRSACFAVHCAGLDLNDTMPGRCSNYVRLSLVIVANFGHTAILLAICINQSLLKQ